MAPRSFRTLVLGWGALAAVTALFGAAAMSESALEYSSRANLMILVFWVAGFAWLVTSVLLVAALMAGKASARRQGRVIDLIEPAPGEEAPSGAELDLRSYTEARRH